MGSIARQSVWTTYMALQYTPHFLAAGELLVK